MVLPEVVPPKTLGPATLHVVGAVVASGDGDAEDGEEEDADRDPVAAVDHELHGPHSIKLKNRGKFLGKFLGQFLRILVQGVPSARGPGLGGL